MYIIRYYENTHGKKIEHYQKILQTKNNFTFLTGLTKTLTCMKTTNCTNSFYDLNNKMLIILFAKLPTTRKHFS